MFHSFLSFRVFLFLLFIPRTIVVLREMLGSWRKNCTKSGNFEDFKILGRPVRLYSPSYNMRWWIRKLLVSISHFPPYKKASYILIRPPPSQSSIKYLPCEHRQKDLRKEMETPSLKLSPPARDEKKNGMTENNTYLQTHTKRDVATPF